ncbi:flagellar hook-length control protein FliK [Neobacillus drentensis]|uniref:flagellar hook-length control protein FliK n=1 Tax=Neobacillus drentensis TaxID=220684 RepID=UPI002FFF10C6
MGITQIDIKINQTKLLSGGKPNSASLSDAPINSFDQILAMFNFSGQALKKDEQPATPSLQNVPNQFSDDHIEMLKQIQCDGQINPKISIDLYKQSALIGSGDEEDKSSFVKLNSVGNDLINQLESHIEVTKDDSTSLENSKTNLMNNNEKVAQSEQVKMNEEDSEKINEILTALTTIIQQALHTNDVQESITNSDSLISSSQTKSNFISVSSLRHANLEVGKVPAQREGLVEEIAQQHPFNSSQVLQGLTELVSALNANRNQKALVIPENIKEKIQTIMNELKLVERSGIALSSSQPNIDTLGSNNVQPELAYHSKPVLNLDKNQVIFSFETAPVRNGLEENKLTTLVSKLPEVNNMTAIVSTVLEKNKVETPVRLTPEENKLTTPVNIVPEENKLAASVNTAREENKVAVVGSTVPNENNLALSVNHVPEENRLAKHGSRVPLENRVGPSPDASHIDDLLKVSGQPDIALLQQQMDGKELKPETIPTKLTVSEFAPEVSDWISRFTKITSGKSGSTEAKFSLYPEHLGHIEIKINSQQGQISVEILTDTPIAKEILEGQVQHLRTSLQQSSLHVQKIDIVQQTLVSSEASQAGLSFSQGGSSSSSDQRAFTPSQDGTKKQKESTDQKERDLESLSITYGGSPRKTSSRIDFTA